MKYKIIFRENAKKLSNEILLWNHLLAMSQISNFLTKQIEYGISFRTIIAFQTIPFYLFALKLILIKSLLILMTNNLINFVYFFPFPFLIQYYEWQNPLSSHHLFNIQCYLWCVVRVQVHLWYMAVHFYNHVQKEKQKLTIIDFIDLLVLQIS